MASDKDKTFEDLVKKVESSPHAGRTPNAGRMENIGIGGGGSVANKKVTNKMAPATPAAVVSETDLDPGQQSMSDADKSDYDDMKGGVDYDDYDFEEEYLPRGRSGGRPVRQKGRGRGNANTTAGGRPNNNKSALKGARPFGKGGRGRPRAKPVTIDTKNLEKVHR